VLYESRVEVCYGRSCPVGPVLVYLLTETNVMLKGYFQSFPSLALTAAIIQNMMSSTATTNISTNPTKTNIKMIETMM